jgi:hypothetical protein
VAIEIIVNVPLPATPGCLTGWTSTRRGSPLMGGPPPDPLGGSPIECVAAAVWLSQHRPAVAHTVGSDTRAPRTRANYPGLPQGPAEAAREWSWSMARVLRDEPTWRRPPRRRSRAPKGRSTPSPRGSRAQPGGPRERPERRRTLAEKLHPHRILKPITRTAHWSPSQQRHS